MGIFIGSYEAKTKLPALIREVQAGQRYTITVRGKAVAELVPINQVESKEMVVKAVHHMLNFVDSISSNTTVDVKALIEEGRD